MSYYLNPISAMFNNTIIVRIHPLRTRNYYSIIFPLKFWDIIL